VPPGVADDQFRVVEILEGLHLGHVGGDADMVSVVGVPATRYLVGSERAPVAPVIGPRRRPRAMIPSRCRPWGRDLRCCWRHEAAGAGMFCGHHRRIDRRCLRLWRATTRPTGHSRRPARAMIICTFFPPRLGPALRSRGLGARLGRAQASETTRDRGSKQCTGLHTGNLSCAASARPYAIRAILGRFEGDG